jgi:hypothetical protein
MNAITDFFVNTWNSICNFFVNGWNAVCNFFVNGYKTVEQFFITIPQIFTIQEMGILLLFILVGFLSLTIGFVTTSRRVEDSFLKRFFIRLMAIVVAVILFGSVIGSIHV